MRVMIHQYPLWTSQSVTYQLSLPHWVCGYRRWRSLSQTDLISSLHELSMSCDWKTPFFSLMLTLQWCFYIVRILATRACHAVCSDVFFLEKRICINILYPYAKSSKFQQTRKIWSQLTRANQKDCNLHRCTWLVLE
jgi:hypothetical protein